MENKYDSSDLVRNLNWTYKYVNERDVFPELMCGSPWLNNEEWTTWNEPYRTTFTEYINTQYEKNLSVLAVLDSIGKKINYQKLPKSWLNGLKLHSALLPLAEFAAVIGNLRGARFGRTSAWRNMSTFGALDEFRHTEIPLLLMHPLVSFDEQFDWTHKLYHTNNWVAIAARHLFDEILLGANTIEFAIGTHFIFETGFTNLQFIALSSLAENVSDHMFEKMIKSIQTDEARHAQIGKATIDILIKQNPQYVQALIDKFFWRNWLIFSVVTGFHMDYLTPLENRTNSFKDFMQEWIIEQFVKNLNEYGLKKPWYWDIFLENIETYHHMIYLSAYTYRSTVWFNFVVPAPEERQWLRNNYPKYWNEFENIWKCIIENWKKTDIGNDFGVHGTSIITFCDLCQLVLCNGHPDKNSACTLNYQGQNFIFCSEPCKWIFESNSEQYANHKSLVNRVLSNEAPANLISLLHNYFELNISNWGKDIFKGDYPWIKREIK